MRFETLPQIEKTFKNEAAPSLKPFTLNVPGEDLELNGTLFKPARTNYFFSTEHPKERIVLHFTAGNIRSDIMSLTQQDRHVSVAFVIARDGTIYQLFPSKFWSGHIGAGVGNAGTGNSQDKVTIGIEISNYGYLVPRDGNLETIYSRVRNPQTGQTGPVDLYCRQTDTPAFLKTTEPFREQSHYASFTHEQLESTIILLRYLTAKYNIPRQFLPPEQRFSTGNAVLNFNGIVSHVNYRQSGKWDIGPAFDWNSLISGVQSASFTPTALQTRSLQPGDGVLHSEEEIEAAFPSSRSLIPESTELPANDGYNPADFEFGSLNGDGQSPSARLFGLLIGINNYDRIRKLKGCVHDVETVEEYLNRLSGMENNLLKLLDEAASREAVVAAFRDHLSQASANDTVLIYYSGHGTLEEADPVWKESDVSLECLVCHDKGATKPADFLLTDKELRFLLSELYAETNAHIVTIFDCCHSGDNTRNAALVDAVYSGDEVIRRLCVSDRPSGSFPIREWEDFIFSNNLKLEELQGKEPNEFMPEGMHLQMAACESDQSAVEVNGEGVFTKTMLRVLNAGGGNLDYHTLANRIRQYLRVSFEQTPRIYASRKASALLATGFLNRKMDPQSGTAEVIFNDASGWQLNLGAIHGLDMHSTVQIEDPEENSRLHDAIIQKIFVDYAVIEIPSLNAGHEKALHAHINGLMVKKIFLELDNINGNPKEVGEMLESVQQLGGSHFEFQGSDAVAPQPADYTLHIQGGDVYLTKPGDPYRPVIRQLPFAKETDLAPLVNNLKHLSRWQFIRELENTSGSPGFPEAPIEVTVTRILQDGTRSPLKVTSGKVVLDYEKTDQGWKGALEINLKNTTKQRLYVAALYLTNVFRSYPDLVPGRVKLLKGGEEFKLEFDSNSTIQFSLDDFVRDYNWPVSIESIKLLVSTEHFEVDELELDPLDPPLTLETDRGGLRGELSKGLDISKKELQFTGWGTQVLHLLYNNPEFNSISGKRLQAMLDDEDLAYFAAGLYFNVVTDENGEPTQLELKKGIKLPPDEKGLLGDVKLWLANKIETIQRRKLYRRLKDTGRIKIVAEGDSWFQYPILVKDILDHLYKVYAVCSFAEAGDTLENYLKGREYLQPIEKEGAKFFLVSGGGNDILGEQFRGSLRDTPEAGNNTPGKYLNETFFNKLDKLKKWYIEMFTELLTEHPGLNILTHSYDYIIPVDTTAQPRKTSWLGKYMIEKKIQPQAEREKLISYMVDQFNDRLKDAVAQFPGKVTYIDVRGLVQRDSWFDEIHPTNNGFQLVADKFIAEIEKLNAVKP